MNAAEAGKKGGQSKSPEKIAAALKNGMATRFKPVAAEERRNGKTAKKS